MWPLLLSGLLIANVRVIYARHSPASSSYPLVNSTDCLIRSYALERALEVNPGLTDAQLSAMADALSGDPMMGSGCVVSLPTRQALRSPSQHLPVAGAAEAAATFFVDAVTGSDTNDGRSLSTPFLTVARALAATRDAGGGGTVNLRGGGTFYLPTTMSLTAIDSGLSFQTYAGDAEPAWLSGSVPLTGVTWTAVNTTGANIWRADLSSLAAVGNVTSLRLAGARLIRARFPNANPETGLPFAHKTVSASSWPPSAATKGYSWVAPNLTRPDTTGMCSNYVVHVGGSSCDLYTPSISHYCGDGAVPGGVVIGDAELPHQPYANPVGAVFTAMHGGSWCSFQYEVGAYAFSNGSGTFSFARGGQQCGRPEGSHGPLVIENVLEELDIPGEFHWDHAARILTLWHNASAGTPPPTDGSLVAPQLTQLVAAVGTQAAPVTGLAFSRLGFRDTATAAFAPHLAPSGSDYAVNREAALTLTGVNDVNVSACTFWRLDNSGVFVGGFARSVVIQDSEFAWLGENGISQVGDTEGAPVAGWGPDGTAGNQPRGTKVLRNVAHELGVINKQACFFFQAVSSSSLIDANVVYNSARHGIQYNDDFGFGSVLSNGVMFNLNRETADTGLFNNWDRLPFIPRKNATQVDLHFGNLFVANFNSFSGFDTDDCSAYHTMRNNVQLYGHFLKSDYSGHTVLFENGLSIFGDGSDQYQDLIPGYFNYIQNCTLIASSEGDIIISHVVR